MIGRERLVLRNATLIDGTGRAPVERATIRIEGSTIQSVGPPDSAAEPHDARVLDLTGRTILPGLIDLHVHSTFPSDLATYLERGVTTIRFAGIDQRAVRTAQARVTRDRLPAPRLFTLGPMLDRDPPSWPEWSVTITSPDDARRIASDLLEREGTDGLIAVQGIRPDDLKAIVETAHDHGRPVMGQLWRTDAREAALIGIDQLDNTARIAASATWSGERLFRYRSIPERMAIVSGLWLTIDWDETQRMMEVMVRNDVAYCPTFVVAEQQAGLHPELLAGDPSFRGAFGDPERAAWAAFIARLVANSSPTDATNLRASLDVRREWVRRFHALGGRVLVGTDMQFGGLAMHRELEILRELGFSALDAMTAATGGGARALGALSWLGTLEPGKAADLIVVAGDPSADLGALRSIELVVVAGQIVVDRTAAATSPLRAVRAPSRP